MGYRCPLCGSALSEGHYHKVVKLQQRKERAREGELEKLRVQQAAATRKLQEARARVRQARAEGVLTERKKHANREQHLSAQIKRLKEANRMLQRHTSPQELGLADEAVLVERLRKEFPQDDIEHVGKGGDVLQFVNFGEDRAGCIVYECKRTERISSSHVAQTALAKKTRNADYAVLVTTGARKRFSGLDQEDGVFLVAPSGVVTLACLCRESLLEMAKRRLDELAKAAAATRLMNFITSPACKTPLEQAILKAERAHQNLVKEMKQHANDWRARHEIYETIRCDVTHVQRNIARVLANQEPLKLEKPVFDPLALPMK
jgi:hypothetical protein